MPTFWKKVFGKKSSQKEPAREVKHTTEIEDSKPSPAGEKRNFNYNLSVSRSGRYKSKERKRVALLENPDLFDAKADAAQFENGANSSVNNNQPSSSRTSHGDKPGTSS